MTRVDLWNIFFLSGLALAVRLYDLSGASLWLDEVLSIRLANLPLSTLWVSDYDPTPPLYYSLLKPVLYLGHSEAWLRLPSVVFGSLTIGVMYLAARRIAGSVAAFATGLLLALSFHSIEYSQEARAYALLGLCLAVSFLGLVASVQRWQASNVDSNFADFMRGGAGVYAAGLLAALYSHNTAVFYWLGVQLFFVVSWAALYRFSRVLLMHWFSLNLVVLVLWLPWLFASIEVLEGETFSWLRHTPFTLAAEVWRDVHGMPALTVGQPWIDIALLVLAGVGFSGLFVKDRSLLVLVTSLILASSVAIWAWGLFAKPVFMLRTILWGSLFSALVVGIGVSCLPRYVAYVFLLVMTVSGGVSVYGYFDTNSGQYGDYRAAAAYFDQNRGPDDILLFRTHWSSPAFLYYVTDYPEDVTVFGWDCSKERASSGKMQRNSQGLLSVKWLDKGIGLDRVVPSSDDSRLWVIHTHCTMPDRIRANAPIARQWRLVDQKAFQRIELFRLAPR
jgi:hypothetical protein